MNSVLQCLTHTPPLAEVLLSPRPLAISHSRGTTGVAGQVRSRDELGVPGFAEGMPVTVSALCQLRSSRWRGATGEAVQALIGSLHSWLGFIRCLDCWHADCRCMLCMLPVGL